MKAREPLESSQRNAPQRAPAPPARDPAPVPLGVSADVTPLLAARARGSRAPQALLGLQRAAGNAAVQRIVAAVATPAVQRFWPFDDEEEGAEGGEGGGEGGSEGAGPVPTEEEPGGGYGGEGGNGPSEEEPAEGGEEPAEGGGEESSSEETSSEGGSSWWWPFDGGESESGDEKPGGGETPAETPGEMPGEPGSEEQVSEETPEETYNRLVGEGAYAAALAVVVRAYGFGGKNVASITYDPSIGDDGLTSGKTGPDQPQRITIGSSAMTGGYTYCASTIGHELQHVQQRTQAIPMESKALREFLAYSWQVIENRNLLSKKYLRANAVQAYEAYQAMTPDDQFMQQGRYGEIVTLLRQLGPATPEEG